MLDLAMALAVAVQLAPGDAPPSAEGGAVQPTPTSTHSFGLRVASEYDGSARQLEVPAPRLDAPKIRIDGRLDDEAWRSAALLTGFTQFDPIEGIPASEGTEVRVVVGAEALYFAIRALDESGAVRATLTERDGFGRSDDYVRVMLDTFDDGRRAYVFAVNPLGVQGDGLWVEGRGGRGDPIDWNPDFLWESSGRVDDGGYAVEIRIPLKTLRFPESDVQRWGLQIVRRIQRTGYSASWAPLSSDRANRLSQSGALTELAGIEPGLFMEVNPTATGSLQGSFDPTVGAMTRDPGQTDVGLNVAYGVTSNLTLDATVNPDFSQIEADAGQITVNERFAVFLPEKRPFFLEGTDVFQMSERLVYTRSIVNPVGAAKLSGKIGSVQVAYLGAVDDVGGAERDPIVNLLRVKSDIGRASSVGLAYTDRTQPGGAFNRVVGGDARLVLAGRYTVSLLAAGSADGGATVDASRGSLLSASVNRSGRAFRAGVSFEDVSDAFRAGSGFIRRTGVTQLRGDVGYTFRGSRGAFVESWGPSFDVDATWNRSDFWARRAPQERDVSVSVRASLRGNVGGFLSYSRSGYAFAADAYAPFVAVRSDGVTAPVSTDAETTSGLDRVSLRSWLSSWERARLSFGATWSETPIFSRGVALDVGQRWSGDIGVTLYPTGSLQADLGVRHVTILRSLDGSRYSSATIPRVEARYQFSRALFVRSITEYASQSRGEVRDPGTGDTIATCRDGECVATTGSSAHDVRVEGLLGYEPSPGTVVYVGYTRQFRDTRAFRFEDVRTEADGLFIKLSYRFRM